MLGEKQVTRAAPVRQLDRPQGFGMDEPGRPPADIVEEMERVLGEQQELVLRLEALADDPGAATAREHASIRHHMACHAVDVDRLIAELGAIEPPEGPPLG